jgi:hypothetical protein
MHDNMHESQRFNKIINKIKIHYDILETLYTNIPNLKKKIIVSLLNNNISEISKFILHCLHIG